VIYADILISCSLAAVLEIYTQHFYTSSSFAQHPLLFSLQSLSVPTSVVDPNPGIRDRKIRILVPGCATNIPDHVCRSLVAIIGVKNA
jgi:hypothetical protein